MRQGLNLSKEQLIKDSKIKHRVIIPLYIPHQNNYYADALAVFKMCLTSIKKTSYYELHISVISDGCCLEVNKELQDLFNQGNINELILEHENIGKLNAILKALRTVNEPYVTITDADILFLNSWDAEVFKVFNTFKKAAVVSPIPLFRKQLSYTSNIWVDYLFSKQLKFRPVKNPDALERFAKSIGWDSLERRFKDVIMTLKQDDVTAVISAAHCVATYKTSYLKHLPKENTKFKLGGDSEGKYLDQPPYQLDGYRLSTYDNYAYHVGNTIDPWLRKEYDNLHLVNQKSSFLDVNSITPKHKPFKIILQKLFIKALTKRSIYNFVLLRKGLTKKQLKQFWY